MSKIEYLDFDLLISESGDAYTVYARGPFKNHASSRFDLPLDEVDIRNFKTDIDHRRGVVRRGEHLHGLSEIDSIKDLGAILFDAVFSTDIFVCFSKSLEKAREKDRDMNLRVNLQLSNAPRLIGLPWEYAFDRMHDRFPFLYADAPLVRRLDESGQSQPLRVKPPLKILIVISNPDGYPRLDTAAEMKKLESALGDLQNQGLVTWHVLSNTTFTALSDRLKTIEPHILHFIGHGDYDALNNKGVLILEDEQGKPAPFSGADLGTILHDRSSLRLVVLNSCEGARSSVSEPFAGTAQSLINQSIPAVISMQFEISDKAAHVFCHEFYKAIAIGYPVEAALAEARKFLQIEKKHLVEWGTPVLYMYASNGHIFALDSQDKEEKGRLTKTHEQTQISELRNEAKKARDKKNWKDAKRKWNAILQLDSLNVEAKDGVDEAEENVSSFPPRWLWLGMILVVAVVLAVIQGPKLWVLISPQEEIAELSIANFESFLLRSEVQAHLYAGVEVVNHGDINKLNIRLSDFQVASLNKNELTLLRNAIFAKYGFEFTNESFRNHFKRFDWYEPSRGDEVWELFNDTDSWNIYLILHYENRLEPYETELPGIDGMVGFWLGQPSDYSVWLERYFLFPDGRFVFKEDQRNDAARLRELSGEWYIDGNHLVLVADSVGCIIGGETIAPIASFVSDLVIDNGQLVYGELHPPEVFRLPLDDSTNYDSIAMPVLRIGYNLYRREEDNPDREYLQ